MMPDAAMPYTTDASGLYAERLALTNPDDHVDACRRSSQGAARSWWSATATTSGTTL